MRKRNYLEIYSELGVQGTKSPAGARGVLAHFLLPKRAAGPPEE